MKLKHLFFLLFTVFLVSCSQMDDGAYVEPITLNEKVKGSWYLMSLKMTDEAAKTAGKTAVDQNISSYFNFPDFLLTLNVDDKNRPTTYKVDGNVPALFAKSGFWALSNDFVQTNGTATKLTLYKDAAKTQKVDELSINSVPGAQNEMEIQLKRTSGGAAFVSYTYKLKALD